MGRVVDLWVGEIVEALQGSGSVVRSADDLDVDRWRRAARQAGRRLGSSVRTGVAADGSTVWAVLPSYEPTASERAGAVVVLGDALYGH